MDFRFRSGRTAPASSPRLIRYGIGLFALLALLAAAVWLPAHMVGAATQLATPDPVTAAWEKASAAGSYHFSSNVTQTTIPVASIANVGRTSRTEQLYLQGENDLRQSRMSLTLWTDGGSTLDPESGLSVRSEGGKTFARRGGGEWEEVDDFTGGLAPQGDFLSYLAALKEVQPLPAESRNGIAIQRYSFTIDSERFALHMHEQMEAALRARGELPPGLNLEVSNYFREMVGTGELWVGANGLPLRQILDLRFPEQGGERVHSAFTVDFSDYGVPEPALTDLASTGDWSAFWAGLTDTLLALQGTLTSLWLALSLSGLAILVLLYRRAKLVQISVVALVIFSQVVGPILSTYTNVKFFDGQTARAAVAEERQAAAQDERELRATLSNSEFNPHLNPLESGESAGLETTGSPAESPAESPQSLTLQAPALQTTDPGTDTDSDGLTDWAEKRIGTSEANEDSDSDGLNDRLEVTGFSAGNQTWYTDPLVGDSNGDGQGDLLEWGFDDQGAPQATPRNTDNDSLPDLFDDDNDGDGVLDRKDLAPFSKGSTAYTEAAPMGLTINGLTANQPTLVEFQIRPQNPQQLSYAFNVLDWPQDSEGQVRDVDGKTYGDVALADSRTPAVGEAYGDMKVLPMLEIRMPAAEANLPAQADLTPFNITVNHLTADGATKVAYVPLSLIVDENTGQRVAFSAQMRYQPTGSWKQAHQVRLAWVVQALVDLPCDKDVNTSADCQADGYLNNVPQMIQSYYSDWTLTGLNVREDHGTDMAIVYEDPAADPNKKDDVALWALFHVLDEQLVKGRDLNTDGQRDLKVSDLAARFDRDNNPSAAQRFDVPNYLQVETTTYPMLEAAIATTTMTKTAPILTNVFKSHVEADRAIKPLLFFAQEHRSRLLALDLRLANNGHVVENGAALTLNLAPTGPATLPVDVTVGMKWMGYCAPAQGAVTLSPCADDEYWETLEARYAALAPLAEDGEAANVGARATLTQLFYAGLRTGFYTNVQSGTEIISSRYRLETESETASAVRAGLQGLSSVPLLAALTINRVFPGYVPGTRADIVNQKMLYGYPRLLRESLNQAKAELAAEKALVEAHRPGVTRDNFGLRRSNDEKLRAAQAKVRTAREFIWRFRLAVAGAAGTLLMVGLQIASALPQLSYEQRALTGVVAIVLNLGFSVLAPLVDVVKMVRAQGNIQGSLLKGLRFVPRTQIVFVRGATIGAVVGASLIWGFFIYGAATSGLAPGSPGINRAFFEAVASTVVTILISVLASNPVGLIIFLIITVIDVILTLICELDAPELRTVPGLGGACFTLTTAVTKYLLYLIYNYDVMVDLARSDLMVTGAPDVTLADPAKGFVAGNGFTASLPITTTIAHKNPDPANGILIYGYLWLFSQENIKRNTFRYSLTRPITATQPVALDQMKGDWQNIVEDHKLELTPMYRGTARTDPAPLAGFTTSAGINQLFPFNINQSYAVPAYECWVMWIPGTPIFIPVCYEREFTGSNHVPINNLTFDIFPATLDGFMALGEAGNGSKRQGWDTRFPALADADNDGLLSVGVDGLDPNDGLVDTDRDGLSDRVELEYQAGGYQLSPLLLDSDNDGLTDRQELQLGTDPGLADTDNDGLRDSDELRYQVVDGNGNVTSGWRGGWEVTLNTAPSRTIWVTSDPHNADGDNDGITDQAERDLARATNPADRLDRNNVPYHPTITNKPPLAVFTDSSALTGYVGPNSSFRYTTTVVANAPMVPGVINVAAPALVGGPPNPLALAFNPSASFPQTVTQVTGFTVAAGAANQAFSLTSTANTRLPGSGGSGWTWTAPTTETPLGNFTGSRLGRFISGAATNPGRQDSYRLVAIAADGPASAADMGRGDVWRFDFPAGTSGTLDQDTDNTTTPPRTDNAALRGVTPPNLACNNTGTCMVVWEEREQCDTVTINWLHVDAAGADGAGGIEPVIFFVPDGADTDPTNGGYQMIWLPTAAGGSDNLVAGSIRGPNSGGFPITRTFCTPGRLEVYETDSMPGNGIGIDWSLQSRIGTGYELSILNSNRDVHFASDGHDIVLNLTYGNNQRHAIAGAILGPDGTVQSTEIDITASTGDNAGNNVPVVASDGTNFLVAWSQLNAYGRPLGQTSSTIAFRTELMTRLYNAQGSPLTAITQLAGDRLEAYGEGTSTSSGLSGVRHELNQLDLDWIGDRYRLSRHLNAGDARNASDLHVEVNGVEASARLLTWRDIDASGALIANSRFTAASSMEASPTADHSLVYNPATNEVLLVYNTFGFLNAQTYSGASTTRTRNVGLRAASTENAIAVYHPPSRGYLIGYTFPTVLRPFEFSLYDANLTNLVATNPVQQISWSGVNSTAGMALACPAPSSVPLADLRFEELPGATSFADASGYGNTATCTGGNCPSAGAVGTANAPLSDYGVRFDGTDDFLTVNRTLADNFSVAYWIKAANGANNDALVIDQGANVAGGYTFYLSLGRPALLLGTGQNMVAPGRIDDDQWHFVVGTHNRSTGATVLYVDGTQVASNTFPTSGFTAVTNLRIGGDRNGARDFKGELDHLQLFSVALDVTTVAALYNRTLQSYCVAAGVPSNDKSFPWSRLSVSQPDTRGGRISASARLDLRVETDLPVAQILTVANNDKVGPDQVIGGSASDPTSGIGMVEVSVNGGEWQIAEGTRAWSFSLAGYSGPITVSARAIDRAGNVGTPTATLNLTIDTTAPTVTVNAVPGVIKPAKTGSQWRIDLRGTVNDGTGSGIKPGSVLVQLTQQSGQGVTLPQKAANGSGPNWDLPYLLDPSFGDPTGSYTVTVSAEDNLGNRATPATTVVRLDATGPTANLNPADAVRTAVSQTITIGGVVSDTNSIAGIKKLEIAFTPIEQVAALPPGLTSDEAEAQLRRTWLPVTLAQSGAGVATTTWSFPIPNNLENIYQIDLKGTDMLDNVLITAGVWRGMIDTVNPRVVMTTTATGASFVNREGQRRYQVRFICAAADRNLNEPSFECPGEAVAEPVRSFTAIPALETLFPDLALRTGLAISYTLWTSSTTPSATARACDTFGRCATASTGGTPTNPGPTTPSAVPLAVVINPAADDVVAAAGATALQVTVAAEASGILKDVTVLLDNANAGVINFTQAEGLTTAQRTLSLPLPSQGVHMLTARASDWAGATQSTLVPIRFTIDTTLPTVTLDTVGVSAADTWTLGSGILQFQGSASDAVGLAVVKVKVGNRLWQDAAFDGTTWSIAYPVPDPEGQTLTVVVRATDRAGQTSEATRTVPVDLSGINPPNTGFLSTPPNPSSVPTASFTFTSTAGSLPVAAFECSRDGMGYAPCASPTTLTDLNRGQNSFRVRAIDSAGFVDPSPAAYTWTVTANVLPVTLTAAPTSPTTNRTARFEFTASGVSGFECRLVSVSLGVEGDYAACTSGVTYPALADGEYSFQVRGRNGSQVGLATSHAWQVTNAAPVAANRSLTVTEGFSVTITLTASDVDALIYGVVQSPAHGVLQGEAPKLTYVPDTGYTGADSFTFYAQDGQVASNVATISITVKSRNQPPDTAITAQPTNPGGPEASFTFSGSDDVGVATFECSLDSAPFAACTTPKAYTGLALGAHTFQVRAVDTVGVADPSPASYTWQVQTVVGVCGTITVYQSAQGQYTAPGWSGAIFVGTSVANTLTGSEGADLMLGLGGNDKLDSKGGADLLCGGDGVDQLLGGVGNDYLDGGAGNDVLNSGTGDHDIMVGGEGNDTLLDGDGVVTAQGGAGTDGFTIALRNGWLNPQGQARFDGLTAGYGNDTVGLAHLGTTTAIWIDISGDERDAGPNPQDGTTDALTRSGRFAADSQISKFERQTVTAATTEGALLSFDGFLVDPTTLTDESGAEFLTEPVGGEEGEAGVSTHLFLPLITQQ